MNGKKLRDQLDQQLEGQTSVAEVIKDLPLYEQILNRGQLMGKMMSRNLIEVVRRQAHEIDRIQASEFREVETHGQTIDERDRFHDVADSLALAISKFFRVDIGEHSNVNCPWTTALEILDGDYITDSHKDRELAQLAEWRALFGAIMTPDELKPEGEQTMWPNPWSQDVAMVAHLIHTMRQQLKAATEWQPMEAVPVDGTPVLVLLEPHERSRGEERIQHAMFQRTAQGSVLGTIGDHFAFDKPEPIGWMYPPAIHESNPPKEHHDQ